MSAKIAQPLIIDEGDGNYKITINFTLSIKNKSLEITDQKSFVEKDFIFSDNFVKLNTETKKFIYIIMQSNKNINGDAAIRFYQAIKKSKLKGVSKREIMRACGNKFDVTAVEEILAALYSAGMVKPDTLRPPGRGRPKHIWILTEIYSNVK